MLGVVECCSGSTLFTGWCASAWSADSEEHRESLLWLSWRVVTMVMRDCNPVMRDVTSR